MLVCSQCGTPVAVAGHPCPRCGHRGAIDQRFFAGQVQPEVAAEQLDLATHEASQEGSLPDRERAWSPWLAALTVLLLGPAGGAVIAAVNLARLAAERLAWRVCAAVAAVQLLLAVGLGFLARPNAAAAWIVLACFAAVVAAVLVRWQWDPVRARRTERPGHHVPGADAFGAFLLAAVIGLSAGWATLAIADAISAEAFTRPIRQAVPESPPPTPEAPAFPMMG